MTYHDPSKPWRRNPTAAWRDKAGDWNMTCETCLAHTTTDDQAMAFEAALGHVAYWHGVAREKRRNGPLAPEQPVREWLGHREDKGVWTAKGGRW